MSKKIRVGIFFGGRTAEHEISVLSARNVIEALDKSKYEPVLIGIDKNGRWQVNEAAKFLLESRKSLPAYERSLALTPGSSSNAVVSLEGSGADVGRIDVVFPIMHGTYGEDGTIQGLLKMLDIPFVGADVLGSAVGMDKDVMKRLLRDAGIPIGGFLVATPHKRVSFTDAVKAVGLPHFIKPANAGSSVGVHKVKKESDYEVALDDAFQYDHKVLIEEFIKGREIECAVLGNESPKASVPGEIIPTHEFYSYEAKYLDENGAKLQIPAKLDAATVKEVQKLAVQTFETLNCEGLGRVDFFLREDGKLFVNEINTIPGFTKISMYPKMWEVSGVSYAELIDQLLQLALQRHAKNKKLKTTFEGD